jgi:ribokinase
VPEVIVLGDINLDLVARLAQYPPHGRDELASELVTRGGGSAANTAQALARCGISTALIGCLGTGALAQELLDELAASGVNVSQVQTDATTASGLVFVAVTPDGQRTMFTFRGANVQTSPWRLDPGAILASRWLHLSGYALLAPPQADAAYRALVLAHRANLEVSLDPGPAWVAHQPQGSCALLPYVGTLLPNEYEAWAQLGIDDPADDPGQVIRRLGQAGVPAITLKLGARGCMIAGQAGICHVPAFQVPAADTTGAGDAFAAGWIAGQIRGLSPRACGLWANAMGAMFATASGHRALDRQAVASFLHQHVDRPHWAGWETEFQAILAVLG